MPLPPGLDGYVATRQQQAQEQQQQLAMISGLMQMQGQAADRQQRAEMFPLQKREMEMKLAKAQQDQEMTAALGPLMASGQLGPDQLDALGAKLAFGGHPGASTVMNIADKRRQLLQNQQALTGMQSRPGVTPATPNDDEGNAMPSLPAQPGLFAPLMQSKYVGPQAQAYQQQLNSGAAGLTPQQAMSHMDRLTQMDVSGQARDSTQAAINARQDKAQTNRIEIRNMFPPQPKTGSAGYGELVTPDNSKLTGQAFLDSLPPSDAALVKSVAEGRTSVKDLSTRGGHREAIIKAANQYQPGFDPVSNSQITAAMSTLERQRGLVMTYEKTAIGGANIALEMSDKVDRTGSPIINKWINAGRKNVLGDPDVTRLNNAVETFTNEYAKVMSGSSGGQATTVSMQQHAREMLSGAMTKDQFRQTVDLMKREMTETRETAFDKQIAEMRGRVRNSGATNTPEPAKPASRPPLSSFAK